MGAIEHWKAEAARWAAWARAPGHDAYWFYRDAFFALVPPPGRATLEVGCGEGRVARDLAARDHCVTAIDVTQALASLASDADAGRFATRDPEAPFVIETSYLARRPYKGTFERDGLGITFKGWCYPLTTYSQALEASGFLVETLREPEPSPTAPPRLERYRRIPNFLMLRALKPGSQAGSRRRAGRARFPRSRRTA